MQLVWKVNAEDVARVKELLRAQENNPLVQRRKRINCGTNKPKPSRNRFWEAMVATRLTTQQNSSPNSPISLFVRKKPFPIRYEVTKAKPSPKEFIAKTLRNAGGIRFTKKIAGELAENLDVLENGAWLQALQRCNQLTEPVNRQQEVAVATYIQNTFMGFGPKQSRNLLQTLGLTRYEIPIDSRVTDWLNDFGFPLKLTASALADINYYNFISDGIQLLCKKCEVLPCIFDAAVFSAPDGDEWSEENIF